jgi:hypothetical protein
MKRPIDTWGQFSKLFPSYSRCFDTTTKQKLYLVERGIRVQVRLSNGEKLAHWAYDLNRHLALIELRDALKEEMKEPANV